MEDPGIQVSSKGLSENEIFLSQLAELAGSPRECCPVGALPRLGSRGPGSDCTKAREGLSMNVNGLCSKLGCSVVVLGET